MARPEPDLYDVVLAWVRDSAGLRARPRHTPSPTRLVKQCLMPLVHELVSRTPTRTYAVRVGQLLDATQESLIADLKAASTEVAEILASVAAGEHVHRLLAASDIQDRVAHAVRDLVRPEWRRITDINGIPQDKAQPMWVGTHPELAAAYAHLAGLRMCKLWAQGAGALEADDFLTDWGPPILAMVADAPHTASSVMAGLGDLETPDLVVDPVEARDWRLATDRSFHTRVRMYWDGRHLPGNWQAGETGACLPHERFRNAPEPGEAMVRESAARTLSPFGLRLPDHQEFASVTADAVGTAVSKPDEQIEAPSLVDMWDGRGTTDATLSAALRRHVIIRLSKRQVAQDDFDDVLYGQCVARRVWIRLHAWELVESRIPTHDLLIAVNSALDKARLAAGVSRSSPALREVDSRRTENTIAIVHLIRNELQTADPVRIAAEYRTRYTALRSERRIRDAGGILTPRRLERLLGSRGEQT